MTVSQAYFATSEQREFCKQLSHQYKVLQELLIDKLWDGIYNMLKDNNIY